MLRLIFKKFSLWNWFPKVAINETMEQDVFFQTMHLCLQDTIFFRIIAIFFVESFLWKCKIGHTDDDDAGISCITSLLLSANENDLALEANEKMISLLVTEDKQHVFEILNRPIIGLSKKDVFKCFFFHFVTRRIIFRFAAFLSSSWLLHVLIFIDEIRRFDYEIRKSLWHIAAAAE